MIFYGKTNFLSEEEFQPWKNLHGGVQIPWMYLPTTAVLRTCNDESSWKFSFGMNLLLNGKTLHPSGDRAVELLEKICSDAGIRLGGIFRIKLGFITKTPHHVWHEAHVDMDVPHLTALFYLSNTNGNTIFYDKLYQGGDLYIDSPEELTELKRVSCEENKYVIFDGRQYHAVESQTDKRQRLVINFNFENTLRNPEDQNPPTL